MSEKYRCPNCNYHDERVQIEAPVAVVTTAETKELADASQPEDAGQAAPVAAEVKTTEWGAAEPVATEQRFTLSAATPPPSDGAQTDGTETAEDKKDA